MEPVDVPEAGRLIMAFVGGTLAKPVLDHLLSDRIARRTLQRPKDMERIEAVRKYVTAIDESTWFTMHQADETRESIEERLRDSDVIRLRGQTESMIRQLADRRLTTLWCTFKDEGLRYVAAIADPRVAASVAIQGADRLSEFSTLFTRRLNKLERRR